MGFLSMGKSLQKALLVSWLGCTPALCANTTADFDTKCRDFADSLSDTLRENATVWFAEPVAAGTNLSFPDNDASCERPSQVVNVDMCRVAMFVPTSARSNVSVEVWLPTTTEWTGRFLSTGNGGLAGCIKYEDMAYTVELGFASVATNNGHNGTSGEAFYNNDDVVEDFAYRAMHTGVVVGKEVSQAFYGRAHNHSYYFGCSTGGRQGFREAQDYPDDFDGYVIGAPAVAFTNLTSWSGSFYVKTGNASAPTLVSQDMWATIHQDILDHCDALDGHVDGILEDPTLCVNYTADGLLCSAASANASACLTEDQHRSVRAIFAPLIHEQDRSLVYPAMQLGAELATRSVYLAGQPFSYSEDWFRYVVYNDPSWDPATLGPSDFAAAARQDPFGIQTWSGDLTGARDHGAKILHYHGQQDQIISSLNSPRYYEHVAATMRLDASQLDEFYRLFRISGMNHCSGGPGAVAIGQGGGADNATLSPDGNVLTAVVRWVEDGVAPDTILGTAFADDEGETVAFQRRHCRWPLTNRYSGRGNASEPDSWECVEREGVATA